MFAATTIHTVHILYTAGSRTGGCEIENTKASSHRVPLYLDALIDADGHPVQRPPLLLLRQRIPLLRPVASLQDEVADAVRIGSRLQSPGLVRKDVFVKMDVLLMVTFR